MRPERIAVTGVGLTSALGVGATVSFDRLLAGHVGFGPVSLFDAEGFRSNLAAEVTGFRVGDVVPAGEEAQWSRSDALALQAVGEALTCADLEPAAPFALAVGATTGGMLEGELMLSRLAPEAPPDDVVRRLLTMQVNASAERLARVYGVVEHTATVCSACSSGAAAIALGGTWLQRGRARRVVAGGTDGICLMTVAGFNALGATDPEGCRPFDARRAGLTLGEGAAFVVLEPEREARRRGARVLAWLSGWALGAEAYHVTQPEPTGATAAALIAAALDRAGLSPADVDAVNAHGTGTPANDAMEARALQVALGSELERIYVSSSKGQLGHTLGAAGAIEAVVSVLALGRGTVPPTGGLVEVDPGIPALRHVVGVGRAASLRAVVSNSFGFGGAGAVLVFEHAEAPHRRPPETRPMQVVVTGGIGWGRAPVFDAGAESPRDDLVALQPVPEDPLALLDVGRSRRFDRASALAAGVAGEILARGGLAPAGVGLALGIAHNPVRGSIDFLRRTLFRGPRFVSPFDFPRTLLSAPGASASLYLGLTGPVVSVNDGATSGEAAVAVAIQLLEAGLARAMLAGSLADMDLVLQRMLAQAPVAERPLEGIGMVLLETREAAQERHATVLARVVWSRAVRSPSSLAEDLPAPTDEALARVVTAAPAAVAVLEASSWARVERVEIEPPSTLHNASSGLVLVIGAALIQRRVAREVLVLGVVEGRQYATVLAS